MPVSERLDLAPFIHSVATVCGGLSRSRSDADPAGSPRQ